MYDLHIHSKLSDGIIDIQDVINDSTIKNLSVVSFTDHEKIFNPLEYSFDSLSTTFISGVELCCNIDGIPIEILGYNFNPQNHYLNKLVNKIRDMRKMFILNVLETEKMEITEDLPKNVFRKDIKKYFVTKYGDFSSGWEKYKKVYSKTCHSIDANNLIYHIKQAGGIPVLAHPMESFKNVDEKRIEKIICSLDLDIIEMVTPKHTMNDMQLLKNIIDRNNLSASVGSDTHGRYIGNCNVNNIDLTTQEFAWIKQLGFNSK